jgi:hypothetical protein
MPEVIAFCFRVVNYNPCSWRTIATGHSDQGIGCNKTIVQVNSRYQEEHQARLRDK